MTRETRTLKCLFPEPKPPRRKNFIKENVKSVRRMEKLFHTNNKIAKDMPIPKQTKISSKCNGINCNTTSISGKKSQELRTEEIIENGIAGLLRQKSFPEDQNSRKKIAPVISSKRNTQKKLPRASAYGNVKKTHGCKDLIESKNGTRHKLRTHSDEDVPCGNMNEMLNNEPNSKCKNQGVQTLDSNEINSLYSEGVIRYASGKSKGAQKSKAADRGDTVQVLEFNDSETKNHSEISINDNIDYVKLNKERVSLASKLASQLHNSAPQPSHLVGVVPKYIKERKLALQREQLAKAAAKISDCPSGHVFLPDNERKETLNMLKKNYQEYVNELNTFPIRTDTLRSQKRKMEIEKQLAKLEEAMKVFSRPKVFVKIDS